MTTEPAGVLTLEQVREIEAKRSNYGCGSESCTRCYPLQYRCDWCGEDFPVPIRNSTPYTCEECEWEGNRSV